MQRRVDIKIGFACNNRCRFCVQGNKRERHPPRSFRRINEALVQGRGNGATGLVITGGEPTLHRTCVPTVRAARALGYETVQIQTNGRRLAYSDFCELLIAAGVTEFSPALHGAEAKVHDSLTVAPGSFSQTVQGIRNLVGLGQRVITNTVVTTVNARQLPDLARLLVDLGVEQYQFAFVHIVGTAAENKDWLVPRKDEVMTHIRAGLEIGRRAGVRCFTEAVPLCLMPGFEDCVAERIIPATQVFDAEGTIDDFTAHRREEGKTKGPVCTGCRYEEECEGPWREYPELFGWAELRRVVDGQGQLSREDEARPHRRLI